MNKTGFIFDLDGVIVDTAGYHYMAWKELADQLDINFTVEDNEQFKGVSRRRCLQILLEMGDVKVEKEQFETWLIEKNDAYLSYISKMDESEILADVPKVLKYLKEKQSPIALGSASKNAVPILEKVGLIPYFDAIVDGNAVVKAKPDPEVFLKAAAAIGTIPDRCVVFEDAMAGIEAANNAGMISIGIGDPEVLVAAKYNFKNFTEINFNFLKELINFSER